MNKTNYLTNSATSQNGKFPVTVEGLNFIQNQIEELQRLAFLGGQNYIITDGLPTCVFNGEVLPLTNMSGIGKNYIVIYEDKKSISTDNGEYTDVRVTRKAKYATSILGIAEGNYKHVDDFVKLPSMARLLERLQTVEAALKKPALLTETGVYTYTQLGEKRTAARIFCNAGSATIGGCTSYVMDVYVTDDALYQEVTTPNLRKYGRYYNYDNEEWGSFNPIDDQLTVEGKMIAGTLYIRHGFLPVYAKIILLRKKRRNKNAGVDRHVRTKKKAWVHAWGIELTKNMDGTWYVPKCNAAAKDVAEKTDTTGKELAQLLRDKILKTRRGGKYALRGVHKNWNTATSAYACIGIGIVASNKHNVPVANILRMKFRMWYYRATHLMTALTID